MCLKFSMEDIHRNEDLLFANDTKISQDMFLSRLVSPSQAERQRVVDKEQRKKQRNLSVYYHLFLERKAVPVCQKMFVGVLGVSKFRILNLCEKFIMNGKSPKEKRGGDRKKVRYGSKRKSVKKFIEALEACESHYGRDKSKRVYLASNLNISKLWKMYNTKANENLKVQYKFFYEIFTTQYNIGFSSPATDACTSCTSLKLRLKRAINEKEKNAVITELRIHKLRAKAFYELSKAAVENSFSFCFDLQKVLPLPKTPIQEAYYSRQLSMYVFCCVGMDSRNPMFFTWTEDQASRGALEIGSALINYLDSLMPNLPSSATLFRLFCDGCGGQNKNSFIVHALMNWISGAPLNIKEIQVYFPVRGHSFLPADRTFGRVEKDLRKEDTIITKEKYLEIYKTHGNVKELGKDWHVKNIKELEKKYRKINEIQSLKRIFIKRNKNNTGILVRCMKHYRFECNEPFKSILKRGQKDATVPLPILQLGKKVKQEKLMDIRKLLEKHFGEGWENVEETKFYRDIFQKNNEAPEEVDAVENEECNCEDEDHALHL